ncbi:helix-turn-helix transcriptional regulator [Micromonospora sp. NPDC049114]|uniref:helix-turn-helix domain-containing protein n=1 Tax=Micromonospora sp. NPDC049114 TaxID=3155498 RepID=UPI0033EA7689
MTTPSDRVGRSVAELRKSRGLTAQQLSDRLDQLGHRIAQSSISKIETGKRTVDADDLVALAVALRTTPNRLLFGAHAGTNGVALTPTVATTGHRAWAWANGEFPLVSTYPKEMSEGEIVDDFSQHTRPVDFRLRRSHPAARSARRLAALIDNLIMFLTSDGADTELDYLPVPGDTPTFRRRDPALGRAQLEMVDVDPAAVVTQALRRTNLEVEELIGEADRVIPSE